jgi:UDP-N-acetylmuramoyl-L-alanyl-D-glutamate--2,6-diaminopimelate ligase
MLKRLIRAFLPEFVLGAYHYGLARFAAIWYRHPSRKLIVIGVTGTNGKSTTVTFIGRLLESMGETVGWTTTASFKVGQKEWVNDKKMTMLGRFQTQRLLKEMVNAGCRYVVVETSSQGIEQFRHIGIDYDVAAFTNLTPEHIEAHGGFEPYKAAKLKLFAALSKGDDKEIDGEKVESAIVVNLDDQYAGEFLAFKADKYVGFGVNCEDVFNKQLNTTPVIARDVEYSGVCTTFNLGDTSMHLKPIGRFYLEDALAAVACVKTLGFSLDQIQKAVESLLAVPGRLEMIDLGQPFSVVVDYAYEPAALNALYSAVANIDYRRIIHVVGSAGGGRDEARRKILGEMSAKHDEVVIVTNEDPYDEDPMQIINEVADAAKDSGKVDGVDLFRILDRQEAIEKAISFAKPDDLVLVTGKGSEPVMSVANGKKVPWDDRVAVKIALNK